MREGRGLVGKAPWPVPLFAVCSASSGFGKGRPGGSAAQLLPLFASKREHFMGLDSQSPASRLISTASLRPECRDESRRDAGVLALCACCLLFSACHSAGQKTPQRRASIALDKKELVLGDEIRVRPEPSIGDWSGEATINTFRGRLHIDSKNNAIIATHENGFTTNTPTEICVTLKDSKGKEIAVSNPCSHVSVTTPNVRLTPESDAVNASGGSGRIEIQPPPDQEQTIGGVPDWVTVTKAEKDPMGPGLLYKVAENRSFKLRSTMIRIGDARFQLTQWGSPYVQIPYAADFTQPPIPVWELAESELKMGKSHDAPPRWILDNQADEDATVATSTDAPDGKGALVVERTLPADENWKTMLWLPGIQTQGERLTVSVWLKAENPVPVALEFGQRTAPAKNCGFSQLVQVSHNWQQFRFAFSTETASCGPENNRFSIHCGKVSGKLWIAGFSLMSATKEQWGSPYVHVPYSADFSQPPIPVWQLPEKELRTGKTLDPHPRWVLDNQPGENATVRSSTDGPGGKAALLVERGAPADQSWKTLLWLPGIQAQGEKLTVSVWLRAENPGPVALEFGRRTAPPTNCGFFQLVKVSKDWQQFQFPFTAATASCGPDVNRFSIHCGKVSGKLWIAEFSLAKE